MAVLVQGQRNGGSLVSRYFDKFFRFLQLLMFCYEVVIT